MLYHHHVCSQVTRSNIQPHSSYEISVVSFIYIKACDIELHV